MDLRIFIGPDWWRRKVLKIIRDRLVATQDAEWADPADDDELYEYLLLALYPLDGYDGLRKSSERQ